MSLPPDTKLHNRYQVIRLVSEAGGMALVYKVIDTRDTPPSTWALKELRDPPKPEEREEWIKLFDQEAEMLKRFSHPNIPRFGERFDERGRAYLVLEFIPGEPLDNIQEKRQGVLGELEVLEWAIQLCQVLDYLHNLQPKVIYRDLKPGNIMITHDGVVKIIDFGIARTHKGSKRRDTVLMGTEAYAAPEMYGGKGETGPETDLYSLGATMYHLLTNQRPLDSRLPTQPPPVNLINPRIGDETSDVVMKAMEKERTRRFQSASEMEKALQLCLLNLRGAIPVSPPILTPPVPVVQPQKICPACQRHNQIAARFCSNCGYSFSGLPKAALRVIQPYGFSQSQWQVTSQSPYIIGRGLSSIGRMDLSFYDLQRSVSEHHAQISVGGQQRYLIQDLNSTNGTRVNGHPLQPQTPYVLRPGDRIQMGQVVVEFFYLQT